ncbi:MAG: hypothetical protein H0X71_02580 [Rubrobacter sp.]|nr:hypothetical protein [Rubrobacter sp.]
MREGRLVRLRIPRIGDSEDAYGRTLANVYLDTDNYGRARSSKKGSGAAVLALLLA